MANGDTLINDAGDVLLDADGNEQVHGDTTDACCKYVEVFRCDTDASVGWVDVTTLNVAKIYWTGTYCVYFGAVRKPCPVGAALSLTGWVEFASCVACEDEHPPPVPCCPPVGKSLVVTLAGLSSCFLNCGDGGTIEITDPPPFDGAYGVPLVDGTDVTLVGDGAWGYKHSANPCTEANRADILDRFRVNIGVSTFDGCFFGILLYVDLTWSGPIASAYADRTEHGATRLFSASWACEDGVLVPTVPDPSIYPSCGGTATLDWV